ncbi:AraC family transcriptional regulator [Streptomyces sp. BPTC-684]|uniref:helix-turn-helix domain-containing protein n=1 Tax=Streptomyces sp. BPTC-684 TaxID=3043734 RepID=UPI0024B262E8|nr:AraC family transcriptional regulator [Streptomyces sp. BPTC-684]WHM40931.1 AraC family transcriptional regulator [Streptomyces sp. BPTC-684]
MAPSLIKPHLVNHSGSGRELDEAVVERNTSPAADTWRSARPMAPAWHVVLVHVGTSTNLRWSDEGHSFHERFRQGQSIVNPAQWDCRPLWDKDAELMCVAFDPAWLDRLLQENSVPGTPEVVPRCHVDDPFLAMLVEKLVTEYEQSQPADSLYAQSLVQALGAHLVKTSTSRAVPLPPATGGLPPRRLNRVLDHMHTCLAERLTLEQLAAVADVSTSHFTRAFRASTGQSPHQYLLGLRLEQARRALLATDAPLAAIAQRCGFADQSHLTRSLRRYTGLTPKALRDGGSGTVGGPAPDGLSS